MSLLELRGISVVDAGRAVFHGIDLTLGPGENLVVFGGSGAGKRTLLKIMAGAIAPSSGTVRLGDPRPGRRPPVGYVPNEGGLLNNLTLLQNVALPAVYHKVLDPRAAERRARGLLEEFGLSAQADRRPPAVNFAARRLAQLARALLIEPALFVLDDPLSDVDAATGRRIRGVLEAIKERREASAVLGTGSPVQYLDWGDRFLLLREGETRIFPGRKELLEAEDPGVRIFLK